MSTLFYWRITEMERETADGYVFRVMFRIDADDNGIGESTVGSMDLSRPDGDLTPFDQLTQEQVVAWVQERLGNAWIKANYDSLRNAIAIKANPVTIKGLPWSDGGPVVVQPEPVRARNADGTFKADDPATPDANEAWVQP